MISKVLYIQVLLHFTLGVICLLYPSYVIIDSDERSNNLMFIIGIIFCMLAMFFYYFIHQFSQLAIDKRYTLYIALYNAMMATHSYQLKNIVANNFYLFAIFILLCIITTLGYVNTKIKNEN